MTSRRLHTVKTALLSALAAFCLVLLFQNLMGGEKKLEHRVERLYAVRDPQFQRSMGSLLGSPILPGNAVVDLQNGDDIFPSMLQSIRGAQRSIVFETYIYWSGEIGESFAVALS
jgi:cardiolipin synthase